jgi:hypothetical protein
VKNVTKIIYNPKSLEEAKDIAIKQLCKEGRTIFTVFAYWQPNLFPEYGTDAVVCVLTR